MLMGIAAGIAAGALWGLVFIAPRLTPGLSPVDLAAGRFISYGFVAALFMVLTMRTRKLPTRDQALTACGMSVLGFTGYYLLLVLAIRDAGVEVPTLIIGTIPVWMMLLGKPPGLTWRTLVPGLLLTAAGLGLMMWTQASGQMTAPGMPWAQSHHFWQGVAFAVAAMVMWTAFGLLNAIWLKRHPDVNATDWANWLGLATAAGAVGLWFFTDSKPNELAVPVNWTFVAIVCIATGVGSAWLATILWNVASQRLSASLCGQLIVSETVFALLYSYAWDAQWPGTLQWLACILFVLGVLASIRAHA